MKPTQPDGLEVTREDDKVTVTIRGRTGERTPQLEASVTVDAKVWDRLAREGGQIATWDLEEPTPIKARERRDP